MTDSKPKRCRIETKSVLLGDSVFWEGTEEDIPSIRSLPARIVAEAVFRSGKIESWGMWWGFPVDNEG